MPGTHRDPFWPCTTVSDDRAPTEHRVGERRATRPVARQFAPETALSAVLSANRCATGLDPRSSPTHFSRRIRPSEAVPNLRATKLAKLPQFSFALLHFLHHGSKRPR